nr:MAG TPA: hypothetical protein [Bacteriophage sp.]
MLVYTTTAGPFIRITGIRICITLDIISYSCIGILSFVSILASMYGPLNTIGTIANILSRRAHSIQILIQHLNKSQKQKITNQHFNQPQI